MFNEQYVDDIAGIMTNASIGEMYIIIELFCITIAKLLQGTSDK